MGLGHNKNLLWILVIMAILYWYDIKIIGCYFKLYNQFTQAIPVLTFGLGTWQIFRRQWKLNLIENLAKRTSAAPIPFPQEWDWFCSVYYSYNFNPHIFLHSPEELSDMEYHKVELFGTFEHDKEIYIGPRSLIGDEKNETGGLLSSGQSGYQVITPFKLSDSK